MTYKISTKTKVTSQGDGWGRGRIVQPVFAEEKIKKADKKQSFLEEVKSKDTLSEKEVLLIKRRLNDGTYTAQEVFKEDGWALTPEQQEKGRAWLMNLWKGKSGVERKNNPFREREQAILNNYQGIRIKEFTNIGMYDTKNHVPVYEVLGNDTGMEYYVKGGEVQITG